MNWSCITRADVTQVDGGKEVSVTEVIPLEGTPYDRVILRNGEPLDPTEQRKEKIVNTKKR